MLIYSTEQKKSAYLFNSFDGFVGFRSGQTYQPTLDHWDDGSGTVTGGDAPCAGRVKFDAQQWREWREKVK